MCKTAMGKGMLALVSKQRKMNVPKLKEFKRTKFTRDVDNIF